MKLPFFTKQIPGPDPVERNFVPPYKAERTALIAAYVGPLLGIAAKAQVQGVAWNLFITFLPVALLVIMFVLFNLTRALRKNSIIRARDGYLPEKFRYLAWIWAGAAVALGAVVLDGPDPAGDNWQSAITVLLQLDPIPNWYFAMETIFGNGLMLALPVIAILAGSWYRGERRAIDL